MTLERVAAGRPERSMVLSGLRGVGKTVLLNALRGQAVRRAWGTGKIEARPDQSIRIPVAQAVHAAVREVAHRHRDPDRVDEVAGVLKSFALRTGVEDRKGMRWTPPIDVPAATRPGRLRRPRARPGRALHRRRHPGRRPRRRRRRSSSTRCRTSRSAELAALCGACHEISQQGAPLIVVGAGLPHLPVALAASKSYAERLFRYVSVDRLPREMADRAWRLPGAPRRASTSRTTRSTSSTGSPTATPTSSRPTARSPGTPPSARRSAPPTSARPRRRPRPSWRSASSAPATTGRPRPSATT